MKEKEEITIRDSMALMLLQGFIKDGYPTLDPRKQVDAAYQYSELMGERKKAIQQPNVVLVVIDGKEYTSKLEALADLLAQTKSSAQENPDGSVTVKSDPSGEGQ